MKKLSFGERKQPTQVYTASKWQFQNLNVALILDPALLPLRHFLFNSENR